VVAGDAGIGFLRRDCMGIHRLEDGGEDEGAVRRPPQEDLEEREEETWRAWNAGKYTC